MNLRFFIDRPVFSGVISVVIAPSLKALKSNEEVIDYVATTPDALGVIGANWIGNKTDT